MTDHEYADRIYCRVFSVNNAGDDIIIQGVFDMINTLNTNEQKALECRYRYRQTYKQTGTILGGIKPEAARRIVNKAVLKLKHRSRLRYMSIKVGASFQKCTGDG